MDEVQLPAGRALDMLVHTNVFGRPLPGETGDPVPYYSSDIAASWEVVQYLTGLGYRLDAANWQGGVASLTLTSPLGDIQTVAGESPAAVVCRAALNLCHPQQ